MQINEPAALRQKLIDACDTAYHVRDFNSIVEVLQILESLPVTKEVLETTRLGRTVNEFRRKVDDGNLAKRAKALVKKWRNEVLTDETPPTPASASASLTNSPKSTAHFNGNSHLIIVEPGASASPPPQTPSSVKTEPDLLLDVSATASPLVDAATPTSATAPDSTAAVVEAAAPKKGRGRTKKKRLLTIDDKIADTTLELQVQLAKAEELKHGRVGVNPPSTASSTSAVPPNPKLSKLISGEDAQSVSVSSPDSPASGAASQLLTVQSPLSVQPVLSPQDQIVKNEIIEKYLKSQTELKSQMHQQYLDALARNEFVEEEEERMEDDMSAQPTPAVSTSSVSGGSPAAPTADVTDSGLPSGVVENGTFASAAVQPAKRGRKARVKVEDSDEQPSPQQPEPPLFETEAEILAKLPPIDPDVLAEFGSGNFEFYVDPDPPSASAGPATYNYHFVSTTNETEQLALLTNASTTSLTSFPVTSRSNFSLPTSAMSTTPGGVSGSSNRQLRSPATITRKIVKRVRVRRQREPRPKSLFDVSDEEDEEEEEDEDEFQEMEVEEVVEVEEQQLPPPEPMEVDVQVQVTPASVTALKIQIPGEDEADSTKISDSDISSQTIVPCKVEKDVDIEESSAKEVQEPKFMRVVDDSEVEALLKKHIVGLNGNYDKTGAFREFHQTILVETYRGEDLHILPYTIIDF